MSKWTSIKTALPNDDIACVVLQHCIDLCEVYPKFAEWDGTEWVDIDGAVVPGVIAWQKAPEYDNRVEEVLSKLAGCIENDKCEEKDCCYFVAADLLERLLEYTKE